MSKRQIHLGVLLLENGHHLAGWRHPDAVLHGGHDFSFYHRLAETAERGKFDTIFLADLLGLRDVGGPNAYGRQHNVAYFEPLTLLSALAVTTKHIGLAGSISTSYNEPYNVARKLASLDHLSGGRAGWNLVTSATDAEALNFNLDKQPPRAARYDRAREFISVVAKLWDTWDDDAFLLDKQAGRYFDTARMHLARHEGPHFQVRGPLNVARSPQGHPVVFQAGASEDGQKLAAETAEVVFIAAQTKEEAQRYCRSLAAKVADAGRAPGAVKVLPGISPIVGGTEAEALAKQQQLRDLIHPDIGVGLLSVMISHDLHGYPLDGPLPDIPLAEGHRSRQGVLIDLARRENLTIRQLYQRAAVFGHREIVGTPESIADLLEELFLDGAADGFNILPPYLPGGLEDFVDHVVPILQRRGLFRTEYEGSTLRDRLGLATPPNQFAAR